MLPIGSLVAMTLARKMQVTAGSPFASHAASRIAAGELDTEIRPGGKDEPRAVAVVDDGDAGQYPADDGG